MEDVSEPRIPWWVWAITALLAVLVLVAAATFTRVLPGHAEPLAPPTLSVAWVDGDAPATTNRTTAVLVEVGGDVAPGTDLVLQLPEATIVALPSVCGTSTAVDRQSWITDDGHELHCALPTVVSSVPVSFRVAAVVDPDATADVAGTAYLTDLEVALPPREVVSGPAPATRAMRILSSPDFLNADVADLALGETTYLPGLQDNGTSPQVEASLDTILDDWASRQPDDVLVAGDLVNGHWGLDRESTGIFGPVSTAAEQKAAIHRAANTYYPQWLARFAAHGLDTVHPAMGDHEYGDNNWPAWKLAQAGTYRRAWERWFTRNANGSARYPDHPASGQHAFSAYAWRPNPLVQMVTLDEFHRAPDRMLIHVDQAQLAWLEGVLTRAKADGVPWVIVQGHVPIVEPVRSGASSELSYLRGTDSELWRLFRKYGVDVYLCGEVHDVTAISRDGILQVSHGGIFQFERTNYLLADVYPGRLNLKVFDYLSHGSDGRDLWETRTRYSSHLTYDTHPVVIGTAVLHANHSLSWVSGALAPYRP